MIKPSPFRYFNMSPKIIRLAVMVYIRFPLSLRIVEDLLRERGVDVSYETVRYWFRQVDGCYQPRSLGSTPGTRV